MQLSINLRTLLSEFDWSVPKLAKESGVNTQTIHNWLKGQSPRDLGQVKLVANTLSVSLDDLCFSTIEEKSKEVIKQFQDEIYAGRFEVVLRPIKE
ncbi:Cro/C1-type HTH DNA-binding domain protein [Bacteriovorax sp. BAL6_X]|nr:Cro/C1-type HTH DNA-binding domain protein [Bacteriovorax sp. BAL6_X]